MISIIIATVDAKRLQAVSDNLSQTVGVPYELITIENQNAKQGLCAIYNQGASQAQYNILCFMHEDVLIHTRDWGQKVCEILEDPAIGLLGVIGVVYKSKAPSGIWCRTSEDVNRGRYYCYNNQGERWLFERNPNGQVLESVVAIDGLWMCTRKEVWLQHPFDSKTFVGFHMYDVDFSTQIYQTHRVCVTYEILMEHFSNGSWTRDWLDSVEAYSKKWHSLLPLSINPLSRSEIYELEYRRYVRVANFLLNEGKRFQRGIGYSLQAIIRRPLISANYKKLFVFLFGLESTDRIVAFKNRLQKQL